MNINLALMNAEANLRAALDEKDLHRAEFWYERILEIKGK